MIPPIRDRSEIVQRHVSEYSSGLKEGFVSIGQWVGEWEGRRDGLSNPHLGAGMLVEPARPFLLHPYEGINVGQSAAGR